MSETYLNRNSNLKYEITSCGRFERVDIMIHNTNTYYLGIKYHFHLLGEMKIYFRIL